MRSLGTWKVVLDGRPMITDCNRRWRDFRDYFQTWQLTRCYQTVEGPVIWMGTTFSRQLPGTFGHLYHLPNLAISFDFRKTRSLPQVYLLSES